jgi:pantoate--beta-alanine ligase
MDILNSVTELSQWRRAHRHVGTDLGFVPTMGALHRGHSALLQQSVATHQHTVLSIFVNPKQFGPNEDLAKYPRTFEADLDLARAAGVSAVFAPTVQDFYPNGFSTSVEETHFSQGLCGAHRPGHFKGVTTVVLKLFNLVQPSHAYFGLKDAQQFFVLRKMVQDLAVPVEMIGIPTVREPDGLALSSRNRYLSAAAREKAPHLYATLKETVKTIESEPLAVAAACSKAKETLHQLGFIVEYLELRKLSDFTVCDTYTGEKALLAAAAKLENTRLIDNILF